MVVKNNVPGLIIITCSNYIIIHNYTCSNYHCITFAKLFEPPAHKIEYLVKLEAKYGPLTGFSSAVDDVLDYLKIVSASRCKECVIIHNEYCYLCKMQCSHTALQ